MKKTLSILAICLVAACSSGGGGGSTTTTSTMGSSTPSAPSVPSAPVDTSFAGMLNNVRANNGAGPVTYDARLGRAAQVHANDMLSTGILTHTGTDGSNAGQRIRREGYDWRTWGENIARGYSNETSVLNGWVNSPGHQENTVNPDFEDYALAKAGSGRNQFWVLVFATER